MKRLFSVIKKETLHILRDWRTLMILISMPIALVVIFGFAVTNEIRNVNIVVVDPSKDAQTMEMIRRMEASGYFNVFSYVETVRDIEKNFQRGDAKIGILFQENFGENLQKYNTAEVQILADASDPNTASILANYAEIIFTRYQMELQGIPTFNGPRIIVENKMLFNPGLKSVYLFVPGVITVILMLICALMTSIALTREKEFGNMELLLVSPLKPGVVVIGKVIPYVVLSFIDLLLILILGDLVFKVPIRGSLILLLLESLLFIATSLSLGIFISTKTNNQQTAMIISLVGLFLPTILLSGFIFPIESMPWPLQWISHIIPARWFIVIIKNIMLKGTEIAFLWKETLILMFMTTAFIVLSIKNFKIRLE
jgi:ABC-2 type transport system permease protein